MQSNNHRLHEALRVAPAALLSLIVHLVLLIVCGLILLQDDTAGPLVLELSSTDRESDDAQMSWTTLSIESQPVVLEIESTDQELAELSEDLSEIDLRKIAKPSLPIQGDVMSAIHGSADLETPAGLSIEFVDKIYDARKNGIDIVIVFDSTGSMGSEIQVVKNRIGSIGRLILRKIPSARFSLVTYRDRTDSYLVRGIPLTDKLKDVERFIAGVQARGGGDEPEALAAGMTWAMSTLYFRPNSQKAMLIFGDAPPHRLRECRRLASLFRETGHGRVSTITCRSPSPLPAFYGIAQSGGGDAYTLRNTRWLMEELLVMAFGREHREDVLKFFELETK